MPQVDLETLVCGDRKIVCETLIDGPEKPNSEAEPPPDLPADSFRLPSLEDEIEWVDRNAFFERKQSTKGRVLSSDSLPNSGHLSISTRISKSKPSIIGLPKRPDSRELCLTSRHNCRPASIRFFPKPSASTPAAEPVSPKVSCIGRVRPKEKAKSGGRRTSDGERTPARRPRFWAKLIGVLGRRRKPAVVLNEKPPSPLPPRPREFRGRKDLPAAPVPSLVDTRKLASGRKPAWWGGNSDVDAPKDAYVAGDDWKEEDAVWRRRKVGPPESIDCGRDWEEVGPASV